MDKIQKSKFQKQVRHQNVLEALKDIGSGTAKSLKNDLMEGTSRDVMDQIFGLREPQKYQAEITPGESLEFDEVFSGKFEENKKLKNQLILERKLREEERVLIQRKSNELKLQLHAIIQETIALAQSTQDLSQEIEIAAIQAPTNPGVYHLIFFERLLEFIASFRKKIEHAGHWLHAVNKRAEKKNYWAMYKKKGSSFLLAPDHYLQRSAG